MPDSDPIVVYKTSDPTEAECIRQALEANGIFCRLLHANANNMLALGVSFGIQVMVPYEQSTAADLVIKDFLNS